MDRAAASRFYFRTIFIIYRWGKKEIEPVPVSCIYCRTDNPYCFLFSPPTELCNGVAIEDDATKYKLPSGCDKKFITREARGATRKKNYRRETAICQAHMLFIICDIRRSLSR